LEYKDRYRQADSQRNAIFAYEWSSDHP